MAEERLASTLSLLTPFLAFLPVELAHVFGVVAVATSGIVIAQGTPRIVTGPARRQAIGFWQVASFVLNGALFVLTGLRLHRTVTTPGADAWPLALYLSGITIGIVVGLRLFWFYTLALALALPMTTAAGRHLPHREPVIAVTFAVLMYSIIVQGLSMPAVLRLSRLTRDVHRYR